VQLSLRNSSEKYIILNIFLSTNTQTNVCTYIFQFIIKYSHTDFSQKPVKQKRGDHMNLKGWPFEPIGNPIKPLGPPGDGGRGNGVPA
jgi:hypothetical protein